MKSFQGTPVNIDAPVFGRVTKTGARKWLSRTKGPQILVVMKPTSHLPKADAYIMHGLMPVTNDTKVPYVHSLPAETVNTLNDGDIVLLTPEGKVNVVYEIGSLHNAIFATNRCNLKCIMCPQPSTSDREDILDYNLALIRLMDPEKTCHLAITGGEPTLLGDGLFELVRACKKHLPKTSLIMLSNGKRFKDLEFTRKLALVQHPNLVIAVPLYSDIDRIHDEIVGIKGSFYETIKALHNLALFRQRVEIRTVIHLLTYSRLPSFAEFIYHNVPFAGHVALMGMETTGLARENVERLWIDPHDYISQLKRAVKYLHRADMNVSIYNHQLCVLSKELWLFCRQFISKWKNIFLEECTDCTQRDKCGGFFETSGHYYSRYIHKIA